MILPMVGERTKDTNIQCCLCGHWIHDIHYGGFFEGKYVDFINKSYGNINLTICCECMTKVMEYCKDEGIDCE